MSVRILYVDDEDDIREVAQMSLELDAEFEVRVCESGAEALTVAAEWQPQLILLDVMMPGMDGPTTLGKLRQTLVTATIPVVFITARAGSSEAEQLLGLGAAGVIAKPFDPIALSSYARAYLP